MKWISVNDKLPNNDDDILVSVIESRTNKYYYAVWKGYLLLEDVRNGENNVDMWTPITPPSH